MASFLQSRNWQAPFIQNKQNQTTTSIEFAMENVQRGKTVSPALLFVIKIFKTWCEIKPEINSERWASDPLRVNTETKEVISFTTPNYCQKDVKSLRQSLKTPDFLMHKCPNELCY